MRDPKQYEAHGRNNPLADEQRREHPYDFVSLPDRPALGSAVGHDRYPADRLTGRLTFTYCVLTPLHVGSGVFETAAQCGLAGGDTPVRGITRRLGEPVLPGSGWKGAVRSRFEAITRSRLGVATRPPKEEAWKLPAPLRPDRGGKVRVDLRDARLGELRPPHFKAHLSDLSPADGLFGAPGYRGRVHPFEGLVSGPRMVEPLSVPPMESPAAHRLAKPGMAKRVGDGVEISAVEGRKFYYDGPLLAARSAARANGAPVQELVDAVPAGATITIEVQVESVTEAELGALLVSAGHGADVGIVRFGGYKPAGLGRVDLRSVSAELRRGGSCRTWQRTSPEAFDPDQAVAVSRHAGLIDDSALSELAEITTRARP